MRIQHRNAAIFAGIFTLIQGGVWAFFAVWSVGIYSCAFDYPYYNKGVNTVGNLFFYSYELGICRFESSSPPFELKDVTVLGPPHRTYAVMLTYGILSSVWIPSAILVLVALVNKIQGKMGARCYYPWLFITATLIVLDVVSTVIYAIDISRTLAPQDYLGTFPYVPKTSVWGLEGLTVVPAVLMVVFSCRAIFIWLINTVLFFVVIQTVASLKKSPTAAFVETEARMRPSDGGRPTQWVRMGRRSVGVPEIEMPQRPARWEEAAPRVRRVEEVVQSPSEERERPLAPARPAIRPTSLPAAPPSPPKSPFYDVYGKPTTPGSPQPYSPGSPLPNQLKEQGVDKDRPWSYVNHRQPMPPKAIPEPDYTMHRGPPRRPTVLNLATHSEEDEEGIKPASRYENNPNVWKVM